MTVRGNGGYPKEHQDVSRRTLLKGGGAALAGLTVLRVAGPAHAFPAMATGSLDDDQPDSAQAFVDPAAGHSVARPAAAEPRSPITGNLLKWEALDSWLTPADNFFLCSTLRPTGRP